MPASPRNARNKPPALRPGDTIAIVAPASNIKRAELDAGCEAFRSAGYKPLFLDSILEQDLYFAGSVERRTRELTEMFTRDDVRAIVCARGGYGGDARVPRRSSRPAAGVRPTRPRQPPLRNADPLVAAGR